ncbi:uncharacterized protein EI90DRAFT_3014354 [Cantharellus anzutake]|uniref:uncharacterized protein n=1 Tax=Cantharellus anzutake TaxID=1750568 RepID=UPI0019038DE3|nr:uncharacterized protein EI90DRAFT_3014354 [Cantharellus anzutake]KAF8335708.1 hypothetical protein EI90DRAFT_3014354 [Cantharellus anzutake]
MSKLAMKELECFRLEYQWGCCFRHFAPTPIKAQPPNAVLGHEFTGTAGVQGKKLQDTSFLPFRNIAPVAPVTKTPTSQPDNQGLYGLMNDQQFLLLKYERTLRIGGASASDALGTGSRSPFTTVPYLNQESNTGVRSCSSKDAG